MLYVTTRNHQDAFTVQHVLTKNSALDGGLFLPLRFPKFSSEDLNLLRSMPFNQRIAEMLNIFFSAKLSGWDVDFTIGRYPVRLEHLPHRLIMAETWHNPKWKYFYLERRLKELLSASVDASGNWVSIAVRMAILSGILMDSDENWDSEIDISTVCDDFTVPISAIYLREMGFPIGNIICCCNGSNQIWDLLCLGQGKMNTETPVNWERLISNCGDILETERYLRCCDNGEVYSVSDAMLKELRKGLHVSVVSDNRTETAIPNVYKTYRYVLQSASAMAYSGLMDYRSKTGVSRSAVILCDESPVFEMDSIAACLDLSEEEVLRIM